jgi:predicted TIM-barrel fold metal-dependent hydrolase
MKLVDCDIHPLVADSGTALKDYMPKELAERLGARQLALETPLPPSRFPHPHGTLRVDAIPPAGGPPGSDAAHVVTDLLDRHDVAAAILLPIQAASVNWWTNPTEAIGLASSFNDYFVERWTQEDSRFRLNMVVAPQDPIAAAAEIQRLSDVPGVAGVWVPFIDVLVGDRMYYPIYEAAQEVGLPIVFHPNGSEGMYQGTPRFAGGVPETFAERFVNFPQIAQGSLTSLVFRGVFERFPKLKFVFTEWGWSWLPQLLWRMDTTWKATRVEVPWVKRLPSEYVRDHVRFTTQPLDEPDHQNQVLQVLADWAHAEDVLMFSSDYPHWDSDDVTRVVRALPDSMRPAIFSQTALSTYRVGTLAEV